MWKYYNPNPAQNIVGDCTLRAVSKALGIEWEDASLGVYIESLILSDMSSSNRVWGMYLKKNGFRIHPVDDNGQYVYTVEDFCRDHPEGTFVLCMDGHVVCVVDGDYYDTWDSGREIPIYYYKR